MDKLTAMAAGDGNGAFAVDADDRQSLTTGLCWKRGAISLLLQGQLEDIAAN